MKSNEIIKRMLIKDGITQKEFAEMLGMNDYHNLQQKFRSDDMKVGKFCEMLNALGCRLVVMKDDSIECEVE